MNPKPDLRADLSVLIQQARWHRDQANHYLEALAADLRAFEQRLQDEAVNQSSRPERD